MRAPLIFTLLASAARTALQTTADISTLINPQRNVGGTITPTPPANVAIAVAYLNITAVPGVDTVLLKMQEQELISGTWVDVPGAATLAQVATGLVKLIVGENIATVAPSASLAVLNAPVPPNFRFQVVHSGAGSFTYSLSSAVSPS